MKRLIAAGITIAVLLAAAIIFRSQKSDRQCNDDIGCITIEPEETIKIGVIQDFSGSASDFGNVQLNAIELALDNRNRTLLDHSIELIIEDEECSEVGGNNAALKIVSDPKIIGVIGTTCSSAASEASKIISSSGLVMISGANSAPGLTSIAGNRGYLWQDGYYRVSSNDYYRGTVAAEYAYRILGVRKAATVDDGDYYTKGAVDIFSKEFERLGGEITVNTTLDKGDYNMAPYLKAIINSDPEFIYCPLFAREGTLLVKQLKTYKKFADIKIMGSSTMMVESFIKELGDLALGLLFTGSVIPEGERIQYVKSQYIDRYDHTPTNTFSAGYDATNILLDSIEDVAIIDKKNRIHIGQRALREKIYSIKNYKGITGILSADEFGDIGLHKFPIYRLEKVKDKIESQIVYIYEPKIK